MSIICEISLYYLSQKLLGRLLPISLTITSTFVRIHIIPVEVTSVFPSQVRKDVVFY